MKQRQHSWKPGHKKKGNEEKKQKPKKMISRLKFSEALPLIIIFGAAIYTFGIKPHRLKQVNISQAVAKKDGKLVEEQQTQNLEPLVSKADFHKVKDSPKCSTDLAEHLCNSLNISKDSEYGAVEVDGNLFLVSEGTYAIEESKQFQISEAIPEIEAAVFIKKQFENVTLPAEKFSDKNIVIGLYEKGLQEAELRTAIVIKTSMLEPLKHILTDRRLNSLKNRPLTRANLSFFSEFFQAYDSSEL